VPALRGHESLTSPSKFGVELRCAAEDASDKSVRGESGSWSIVLSAPGFMGGLIQEYWFTAKWHRTSEPTPADWARLRSIVEEAGGSPDDEPENPVLGTNMWRWKPPPGTPAAAVAREGTPSWKGKILKDPHAASATITGAGKVGRNDSCPCGSGKKFKKCCSGKPAVGADPCGAYDDETVLCGAPGVATFRCAVCDKSYSHCARHKERAQTMMSGHVLRTHPEIIPVAEFDKMWQDPVLLSPLEEQRTKNPDLWKRLFEYIEERKRMRAPN